MARAEAQPSSSIGLRLLVKLFGAARRGPPRPPGLRLGLPVPRRYFFFHKNVLSHNSVWNQLLAMSVSLFPSKDSFETANITAGSRDINSASSASGDEERALRYRATGLSTAEERETLKALRVAKDMRHSAKIAEKYTVERCELKKQLEEDNERRFKARELRKKQMLIHWSRKLDRSSFLVDQVAES